MSHGLSDQIVQGLCEWAEKHAVIQELWLFGSRAKGTHRPDSDVDLGIILTEGGDALGAYTALADRWQSELRNIAGRRVSLEAVEPGHEPGWSEVTSGRKLWARQA